jgi:hypothetical protein
MSDQPPERRPNGSLSAYDAYQREMRNGNGSRRNGTRPAGARPREFDENGFPVPQGAPTFLERVARLLNPR